MCKKFIYMCLVVLFTCFNACDFRYPLEINRQKKYTIACNENLIELKVEGLRGSTCFLYLKAKKGDFVFNTDSFILVEYPQYRDVNKRFLHFRYNNNNVIGSQLIEQGKTLNCYFSFGEYGYNSPITEEILIPPSNFIMCEGKPLVTDTIRISLK